MEPAGLARYPHGGDARARLQRSAQVFAWLPKGRFCGAGSVLEDPVLALPLSGTAAAYSIDSEGFVIAGAIPVRSAAAADVLCRGSAVACLFAKARIALGDVPVYADAYAHSLLRANSKEETAVCFAATQASFGFLLLAERACDTRAAWTVDGSVRPAAGDTAGLAGFAGCRHCGTTFASRTEYILPTSTGSPGTRTASSYDIEVAAQATVAQREREDRYMVLFDFSSPVVRALSFSMAHDRHRADYFLNGVLAAWTDKWEGKVVLVLAHVKAHAGITVNEWADVEAKASLAEEISITVTVPESLSHASAVVVRPETTGAFSAAAVRVCT